MNYFKQLNTFYRILSNNPISPIAQCFYCYLLNKNNELNWTKEFKVANSVIMAFTSLSISSLQRARNELVQKGYIIYKKGSGNSAGKYQIIDLVAQIEQQSEQQPEQQPEQQIEQQVEHINKHKHKTKTETNKKVSKKYKKETFDNLIENYTTNEELREELKNHLATRKVKKATLTNRAIELSLKKLDELVKSVPVNDQEGMKLKIVQRSIENGWIGFFPLPNLQNRNNDGWDYIKKESEKNKDQDLPF